MFCVVQKKEIRADHIRLVDLKNYENWRKVVELALKSPSLSERLGKGSGDGISHFVIIRSSGV
jgi:hypothetical protein